jgi:hypothetical protein
MVFKMKVAECISVYGISNEPNHMSISKKQVVYAFICIRETTTLYIGVV